MNTVSVDNYKQNLSSQWIMLICVFSFFGVILHIYLPNIGGVGLALPLNIISCFCVAFFVFIASIQKQNFNFFIYSNASNLISVGLVVLILLCFISPVVYRYSAYLTAYWMLGLLVFYQILVQFYISDFGFKIILLGIIIASIIESLIAISQVFNLYPVIGGVYPPLLEERPYGIFQQVNVFSSFICVGIASAFGFLIKIKNHSWLVDGCIFGSIILMSIPLPLSQSLTGYLSLFLVILCFIIFIKNKRRDTIFFVISVIIGLIIGYLIKIYLNISDVSEYKFQTSHVRWVLWQHSVSLFTENFLWGTGVGSFESVFLERFGGSLLGTSGNTMSHPHNEILRWMVEGGVIGLVGVLLIISGGISLWKLSLKNDKKIYLIICLPIILHMMTEFPLWLSTPHAIVLVLLLRCADTSRNKYIVSRSVSISLKSITAIFGVLSAGILYFTLQGQQYLTYIEKTGQQAVLSENNTDKIKWDYLLLYDRYSYDLHMGYLLKYNNTNNMHYLQLFNDWADEYSQSHPDINVYYSQYLVLNALGKNEAANKTYKKAKWLFVDDKRFE